MELQLLEIHAEGIAHREAFIRLYEDAFPRLERKPVSSLEKTFAEGKNQIFALAEEERFVGLAVVMSNGKCRLLDYLAIEPALRDRGYGSAALGLLLERYSSLPFVVEIERSDESAADNAERMRRREFYLRNGMESSGVFVRLFHVDYELLCANGCVGYGEYSGLLSDCMGRRIGTVLREIK